MKKWWQKFLLRRKIRKQQEEVDLWLYLFSIAPYAPDLQKKCMEQDLYILWKLKKELKCLNDG